MATAFAVSGCMHRPAPVAAGPHLDAIAYNGGAAPVGPHAEAHAAAQDSDRGLFTGSVRAPASAAAAPTSYAVPTAYAAAVGPTEYHVDAGDRVRVVVYGQDGLTNSYTISANGSITMPLIGAVRARGLTPTALASAISARLRNGYIRDPSVAVEVEAYRPFFILGEVAAPGQYPYVPNMTVESAIAIAGGFTPRARQDAVQLTRTNTAGSVRAEVPTGTPLNPGDSIVVKERWF